MHRTPWTKPASSFPSDRMKPIVKDQGSSSTSKKNSKRNVNSKKDSGSPSQLDSEPGKSKEVKKLESFLQALQTASGLEKDPKGGCYCLARTHDLSPYTPICRSCGLILCSLNQPYHSCPDCHKPLLSSSTTTTTNPTSQPTRKTLIEQIESQLTTTISHEIEHRQRALDEARKAVGAFPALPSGSSSIVDTHDSITPNQTHKVLSLIGNNNKNKNHNRRTITTTTTTTKHPSRSGSVTPNVVDDEPKRLAAPKLPPVSTKRPDPKRPFENFLHGSVTYKPTKCDA